ncbi:hypothetical protein BN85400180 [Alteracholeplasma palmae J233]|uniref:Uncharacterized protein n=1 Tax=Alteracholeplasma palmae (strain ATCC 49389 / J233) TaxID=1318466 RepID=U4KN52_ALTPJ|nr:hypothetical protein [Alteracholeplasma palmae]CCV63595.1 hypothetical protein BN85400180 [Alteracholeplasma palmae J233]
MEKINTSDLNSKEIKHGFINKVFLLINIGLAIICIILNIFSDKLSYEIINIAIIFIAAYSFLFTAIGEWYPNKKRIDSKFLLNALIVFIITLSLISLKKDTYMPIINKDIENLLYYLKLTALGKLAIDVCLGLHISITF